MNTVAKGDNLENAFHQYLLDQQDSGQPVFGMFSPETCKIYKKKKYYCKEREADVEFDIVLEIYRIGRKKPSLYVVFECKNHGSNLSETYVNDFSSKISRIFRQAVKGVIVVTSKLQSGAEAVARNARMGIIRYNEHGMDTIAERRGICIEHDFVRSQILQNNDAIKSLKFSAYHDGKYFGTVKDFLKNIDPGSVDIAQYENEDRILSIPFFTTRQFKNSAAEVLSRVNYMSGAVDLDEICRSLSIDLQIVDQDIYDADGAFILGSANFEQRTIQINSRSNSRETRERFTIGHEIGHFCLFHEQYLRSEAIIERDLFITSEKADSFNYERLEYQANAFCAELILPDKSFLQKTEEIRRDLDIKDRGHGYIFVDDQPCNCFPYEELLARLSTYFRVSKQAIEVKFKREKMVTDQRRKNNNPATLRFFSDLIPPL